MKRTLIAIVVVFIAWSVLDFVLHGVLLQDSYAASPGLWRPMDQINLPLMYLSTLAYTACFVIIYAIFVRNKSFATGIKYGALWGVAAGVGMGFGSYSVMPIPLSLAMGWFAGTLVESIVAGALTALIVKAG